MEVNGINYDLRKIKEIDEDYFLRYCQDKGKVVQTKGFWNKLLLFSFWMYHPMVEFETIEHERARAFFNKRRELNDRIAMNNKLSKWKAKSEVERE